MIILAVNPFSSQLRESELNEAYWRNRNHPLIGKIIESKSNRATFGELFALASENAGPDDILIIANSDICFDDTLALAEKIERGEAWALTRWDRQPDCKLKLFARPDSQDAWVFRGPINSKLIDAANFCLGVGGCDNRLAQLIAECGYRVRNPARSIRAIHLHANNKTEWSNADPVQGPYLFLPPEAINVAKAGLRVLHVALKAPNSPQNALRKALQGLGEYEELDWMQDRRSADKNLKALADEFQPDLIFMQVQTPGVFKASTVKSLPGFKINWTGDVRQPTPDWYFSMAEAVNVTCFTNQHDVDQLRKKGLKAEYMQIGFDPEIYKPSGKIANVPDIIFLGNDYGNVFPCSHDRRVMVDYLRKRYGDRFQAYGRGFGDELLPEHEAASYRGCKVAINQNHYVLPRFSSDRIFRAMGCGAYVVNRWYPGVELEFSGIAGWTSLDGLANRIDWALQNETERKEQAKAFCTMVHERHTWEARMDDLLEIMRTYR